MEFPPGTKESYLGAFLENIFYGAYLSAFFECCAILYKKKTGGAKHIYLLVTTGLMFVLITMRCIIDTFQCITPFAANTDLSFTSVLGTVTNSCWIMVTVVADMFLVFRTYVLWNGRWWLVIIPALLCLANIVPGVTGLIVIVTTGGENMAAVRSLDAFNALSLSTNIVCTGLIAFRIVQVHRELAHMGSITSGRSANMKILSIIVESAGIYTMLLIVTIITNRYNFFATFILIDCTPAIIGLVFSYIIIRVSRGTSYGESTVNATTTSFRYRPNSHTLEAGHSVGAATGTGTEVQIRLEGRHTETDIASRDDEVNLGKYSPA